MHPQERAELRPRFVEQRCSHRILHSGSGSMKKSFAVDESRSRATQLGTKAKLGCIELQVRPWPDPIFSTAVAESMRLHQLLVSQTAGSICCRSDISGRQKRVSQGVAVIEE
jgi:hypothetical protein